MGSYLSQSTSRPDSSGTVDPYPKWNPQRPSGGDTVLIPIDDSSHAESAFHWYLSHMHKPTNIVRLLYCVDMRYTTAYSMKEKAFADDLAQKKRTSEYLSQKYYKILSDNGVSGSVQTFVGFPGEVILDHAIRTSTSSIVMGSRGLNLLHRTILGSVSTFVVNNSKVPVTIVPSEK